MRVLCTLPNAAEEISGVRFERTDAGMLSADLDADAARAFARIRGYVLVPCSEPVAAPEPEPMPEVQPAPEPAKRVPGRPVKAR
jgi:hypothetical protein